MLIAIKYTIQHCAKKIHFKSIARGGILSLMGSVIDLLILGLIFQNPMHAYEIAKKIQKQHLDDMVKLSIPAIYKNVIKLDKKGYLRASTITPNDTNTKTLYTITAAGKEYFNALMQQDLDANIKICFDFNTFILNLDNMAKSDAMLLLKRLASNLSTRKNLLNHQLNVDDLPFTVKSIIKQQYMLIETLMLWLEELMLTYKSQYKKIYIKELDQ